MKTIVSLMLAAIFLFISPTLTSGQIPNRIVQKAKPAVILILCNRSMRGSGFFIPGEGWILTANHVLEKCVNPEALLATRRPIRLREVDKDSKSDLALLVPGDSTIEKFPFLPLGEKDVAVGDEVMSIGHSCENPTRFWLMIRSRINGLEEVEFGDIRYSPAIYLCFSGGPLPNSRGQIIGLNIIKWERYGYAVSLKTIRNFLSLAKNKKAQPATREFRPSQSPLIDCIWIYTPEGRWCRH